jgi:hypothetical protein
LREVTPAWQGITGQLREAFVMCLAFQCHSRSICDRSHR